MAKLETDLQNAKNKIANFCTDFYGVNSITLSPGKCSCSPGYVFGKNNQCVTMTNYCTDTYGQNIHPEGNQCFCDTGYSYNDPSKTCKILEVKKEIAQPVVKQKEPVKNISNKTTMPSKSSGLTSLLEKTVSESSTEKEEITPQVNPEPLKQVKWYRKIFNWFK